MRRLRLAVIGFGRLGRACAMALRDCHDMELAGVVLPAGAWTASARPFEHEAAVGHVCELKNVDAALICVPAPKVLAVAREVLQQCLPVVECAILEGHALQAHYEALGKTARNHRVAAVAGEETLVFPVADVAALEASGSGVVLERRGTGGRGKAGPHQSLLLEARFDVATFAARVMLDAARRLPQLKPGAHPYSLWA